MTKEMRELLERSYKGNEVIEYIESLERLVKKIPTNMRSAILNETTTLCEECSSREGCP